MGARSVTRAVAGVSDPATSDPVTVAAAYRAVRDRTVALAAPLSDADASAQSMADASPAKWHLAHSSWFWETFLLRDHVAGYRLHDERWPFLFNSYYEAEGARHARAARGLLTRPSLDQILDWRAAVDGAMLAAMPQLADEAAGLLALGIAHEEQHQELLLTDILHLFAQNPLGEAVYVAEPPSPAPDAAPLRWITGATGVATIGHAGDSFGFDCEGPRHATMLAPHAMAHRLTSNGEWDAFVADGGYRDARLWLADGWAWVQAEGINAPLYWRDGEQFTLAGWQARDPAAPVRHISFYEADAFAHWAGARLPTEAEWEVAAAGAGDGDGFANLFGACWQWTASSFLPYPGFRVSAGAVGEYNGKFMNGQRVLRGSSIATTAGHSRPSYRNFFYPHQRWQFTGLRLARDEPHG